MKLKPILECGPIGSLVSSIVFRLSLIALCFAATILLSASSDAVEEAATNDENEPDSLWRDPFTGEVGAPRPANRCPMHGEMLRGHDTRTVREILTQELSTFPEEALLDALRMDLDEELPCETRSRVGELPDKPSNVLSLKADHYEVWFYRDSGRINRFEWKAPLKAGDTVTQSEFVTSTNQLLAKFALPQRITEADVEGTKYTIKPPYINGEAAFDDFDAECFRIQISKEHVPAYPVFIVVVGSGNGQILNLLHLQGLPKSAPDLRFSEEQARELALKQFRDKQYHRPYIEEIRLSLFRADGSPADGEMKEVQRKESGWRYIWRVEGETHYVSGVDHAGQFVDWAWGEKIWLGKMGSPSISIDVETGEVVRFEE